MMASDPVIEQISAYPWPRGAYRHVGSEAATLWCLFAPVPLSRA